MTVGEDKAANLARAAGLVKEAASKGAQLVALPVSHNIIHDHSYKHAASNHPPAYPACVRFHL